MYSIAPEIFGSLPPGTPIQKNLSIKWYFIFILSEGWLFIYRPTNPYTKKTASECFLVVDMSEKQESTFVVNL